MRKIVGFSKSLVEELDFIPTLQEQEAYEDKQLRIIALLENYIEERKQPR